MCSASLLLPKLLLLNVMSIFAFVGDSLRRYDDVHTFRVINNTVNSIVPVLIQVRHARARAHAYIHTYTHSRAHTHIHTHTHAHTYTYTHTSTLAHTRTHTHT